MKTHDSSEPIGMLAAFQLIRPCFLKTTKYHDLLNNFKNIIQTCKCVPTLLFENTFVFLWLVFLFVHLDKVNYFLSNISNSTCLLIILINYLFICQFLPFLANYCH